MSLLNKCLHKKVSEKFASPIALSQPLKELLNYESWWLSAYICGPGLIDTEHKEEKKMTNACAAHAIGGVGFSPSFIG